MPGPVAEVRVRSPRGGGRARCARGLSLMELLLVVALMGILAGMAIPFFQTSLPEQLQAAAQVTAADLAYAQSLAVGHGSRYRITFEPVQNRYRLTHSGTNASLNNLPRHPLRAPGEALTQQTTDFDELPHTGSPVKLLGAYTLSGAWQPVTTLEFGPLGETTRTEPTYVWFQAGAGGTRRFISIRVQPTTGSATISGITAVGP